MCLKVGGWARFETGFGYNGSFTTEFFNNNLSNRSTNDNNWRVKGVASFDARSQTEYGTAAQLHHARRQHATTTVTTARRRRPTPTAAFIQWAGFTIGHSTSFFDFYSVGANQYSWAHAGSDSGDGGWTVFGYTAHFGNGLSASLSAAAAASDPHRQCCHDDHHRGLRAACVERGGWQLRRARLSRRGRQLAGRPGLGLCPDHGRVAQRGGYLLHRLQRRCTSGRQDGLRRGCRHSS